MDRKILIICLLISRMVIKISPELHFPLQHLKELHECTSPDEHHSRYAAIINEITAGPLKDVEVTLVMEAGTDRESICLERLVLEIRDPLVLLRLSQAVSGYGLKETQNDTELQSVESYDFFNFDPRTLIMILWSEETLDQFIQSPPKNWRVRAIVLLSLELPCSSMDIFQTPLIFRTSHVSLICPRKTRGDLTKEGVFELRSWKPYEAGLRTIELGPWKSDVFRTWDDLFVDRFSDMSRKTISILGNPEDIPLFYDASDGDFTGVTYMIIKACSSVLHFRLNVTADDNLAWPVILDSVKSGKTDMFINYAPVTPERYADYEVLVPYHQEGYSLNLLVPPPLPRWKNIIYPFAWSVWPAIIVSLVCSVLTYHVICLNTNKSFITNALVIVQGLLSNCLNFVPKQWRIRIFLLLWWLMSWILHMSYTCNLTAVLTVPVFPNWIQTAQELADSNYRLCMLYYDELVPTALNASAQPVLSTLGRKLDLVPLNFALEYDGEETCLERVLNGTHAHIDSYSFLKVFYNVFGQSSTIYTLSEQLYPSYLFILVHKHSAWSYKIAQAIQRMTEAGLVDKWYRDAMDSHIVTFDQEKLISVLQPLSMDHLQGSFYLLAGGIVLSLSTLVGELFSPGPRLDD